jgi:phosphate transport system substrate-binding protein
MDWAAWWAAHDEAVITLVIGAVIGAFINWVFFRRAEKPKRLGWEVMSRNAIIKAAGDERDRLQVLYDGDPVGDPNIIIVRVANTGKREIVEADFPTPIELDFHGANVLTIEDVGRSEGHRGAALAFIATSPTYAFDQRGDGNI